MNVSILNIFVKKFRAESVVVFDFTFVSPAETLTGIASIKRERWVLEHNSGHKVKVISSSIAGGEAWEEEALDDLS